MADKIKWFVAIDVTEEEKAIMMTIAKNNKQRYGDVFRNAFLAQHKAEIAQLRSISFFANGKSQINNSRLSDLKRGCNGKK